MNCLQYVNLRLFADDKSAFKSGLNLNDLITSMRENLLKLKEWFQANKLTFNMTKTSYVIFHTRLKRIDQIYDSIPLDNEVIYRVDNIKYLGLLIDEVLCWRPHVMEVYNSLLKYFGIFNRLKDCIPTSFKRQVFISHVQSKIRYGVEIYGSAAKAQIQKLQILTNKLAKILYKMDRLTATNHLHCMLNILKIPDLYNSLLLQFVH